MVSPEDDGEVLLHLGDDVRTALMRQMDVHELVAAAEELDIDDLADFVEHLPETVTRQVLKALDAADRARLEAVHAYGPDTAGRPLGRAAGRDREGEVVEILVVCVAIK